MSTGGSKTQTTTATSEPPKWAVPYFQSALQQASNVANQPYQAYTGQQTAGLTADQNLATDLIRQQALAGQGGVDAGNNFVTGLLSGQGQFTPQRNQFAGENPYLDQLVSNAQQDVTRAYTDATLPSLMSQFNAGGAYGGSAHQQALSQSQQNLADQLGRVSTNLRGQDYQNQQQLDEGYLQRQQSAADSFRNSQLGALGALPSLNQAGYLGGQMLSQQGGLQQATNQAGLDTAYNNYLDERGWNANQLGVLTNALGAIQGGTSTQTGANPNYRSAGQNILSGAATLGGLLMMSDRDAKTDKQPTNPEKGLLAIRQIPLEEWRYKGDDAPHVGTYSQDFYKALGMPPRSTIDAVDMFGALTGAVKSLDRKVNRREKA